MSSSIIIYGQVAIFRFFCWSTYYSVISKVAWRLDVASLPLRQLAGEAYQGVRQSLECLIKQCGSGQELIERGFEQDIDLASEMNVSNCVPTLIDGAYSNHAR